MNHLKSSQSCLNFEVGINIHEKEGEFSNMWKFLLVEHINLEGSWLHTIMHEHIFIKHSL